MNDNYGSKYDSFHEEIKDVIVNVCYKENHVSSIKVLKEGTSICHNNSSSFQNESSTNFNGTSSSIHTQSNLHSKEKITLPTNEEPKIKNSRRRLSEEIDVEEILKIRRKKRQKQVANVYGIGKRKKKKRNSKPKQSNKANLSLQGFNIMLNLKNKNLF